MEGHVGDGVGDFESCSGLTGRQMGVIERNKQPADNAPALGRKGRMAACTQLWCPAWYICPCGRQNS
jgi:hypothetical protein